MEQGSLVDGPTEQGSFAPSAAFRAGSRACAGRSDAASDSGATANVACLYWLRNHDGFSQEYGYDVAAPYPTSPRVKFGNGQLGNVHHAAGAPSVLARQMGLHVMFLADQDTLP